MHCNTPRARSRDPWTSHHAAVRAARMASSQQRAILAVLRAAEGVELPPEDIGDALGLPAYAVRKRLPELQRQGLALPTGRIVPSRGGRMQRLWVAAKVEEAS